MSEFVAVGPARNLDGPLPVAPEYGLLTVPGVLVSGDSEWLNGVNVWGYPCDTPSLWEPCSDGTFRTKNDESTSPSPRFDSFVAYLPITCSTISGDPEDFARRAEAVLDATLSYAVEEALAKGVPGSTNPFFGDTDMDALAGGAAVPPDVGLSYLENAIGLTGRRGMIHASPAIVAAWGFEKLKTNGSLETVNGTPVASGGGYIGVDPASGTAAGADTDWAFATGPVSVYVAEAPGLSVADYVDREGNVITYRAEKFVLATWDGCLQSAVLIDWGA